MEVAASGAVSWQPTGLMGIAEPPLGLYVGNQTAAGAGCWQPTGLSEVAEPPLGL